MRLLKHVLEELDYHDFYKAYSHKGKNSVIGLKFVVYAYSQGIYSSRKMEKTCRRNINFLWFLVGVKHRITVQSPAFENAIFGHLRRMFSQLALFLLETGEVTGKNIFIAGTKIEFRSKEYTFVWKKSVGEHKAWMNGQLLEKVDTINKEYREDFGFTLEISQNDLPVVVEKLKYTIEQQGIKEIHGRGKRKSQL